MAIYIYQGMLRDFLDLGFSWTSGNFAVLLISDDALLDTSTGLDALGALTWGQLAAQPNVAEIPAVTNYLRFALPAGQRSYGWNAAPVPPEAQALYDNATTPVEWSNLGSGATVGAYAVVRTVDGGLNDVVWFADSDATGLPAATNGEDFRITINTGGLFISRQG